MANGGRRQSDGLRRDLGALRRYAWIPVVCVVVGVVAAFALGPAVDDEQEARFRANVVVNALPPLFGPPVLPGPFDYAAVATSDEVVGQVAAQHGLTPDELRPRFSAEPRVNTPEIDFKVTGDDALSIAEMWNQVFAEAAVAQTPLIQAELTMPYVTQLDEAGIRLTQAANVAASLPNDALAQAGLAAAQENYETASKLDQSYNIVRETMTAQSFTVKAPHEYGGGLGSPAARVAAGAIAGLVLGVLLAVMLDAIDRRKARADEIDEAPPSLRRVEQHTGSSR